MIGDIAGSKYEFTNIKTKDFPLLSEGCDFTDDSIMTVTVAEVIMRSREAQYKKVPLAFCPILVQTMHEYGHKYPFPIGAYGGNFGQWLGSDDPHPYHGFGNGSSMRVSLCRLSTVEP